MTAALRRGLALRRPDGVGAAGTSGQGCDVIPALLPGVEWVSFDDGSDGEFNLTYTLEPAKQPEIPPPCWDQRPIDSEKAIQAVRAMCGG